MKTIPSTEFDAMMSSHQKAGGAKTINLGPGLYETQGSAAWWLAPNLSLIGAGIDRTVIRRTDAKCKAVLNAWVHGSSQPRRISDLTIDCNATLQGPDAPSGIAALEWKSSVIERVKVVGLGSFKPESESFGIIISDGLDCQIRGCLVEKPVGGYVSAFCVSGQNMAIRNCTANFTWKAGWDVRLQAFCLAGAKEGSTGVTIEGNRTSGALFGVFCDTGPSVTGLRITGNRGKLRNWGAAGSNEVRLVGDVRYSNVQISGNTWSTK